MAKIKKKDDKKREVEKWTKRGAIIGGVWGLLLVPIIFLVFSFLFYDSTPSPLLQNIVFTLLFLPSVMLKPLYFGGSNYSLFLFNFVGWVLVGGIIGSLFGLTRGDKQ